MLQLKAGYCKSGRIGCLEAKPREAQAAQRWVRRRPGPEGGPGLPLHTLLSSGASSRHSSPSGMPASACTLAAATRQLTGRQRRLSRLWCRAAQSRSAPFG